MAYQLNKTLPFWIKRYIFMDKTAKLEPLYHFDHVQGEDLIETEKEEHVLKEKV